MKQVLTGILTVLMLLFVLCFPQLAIEGATEGLLLWFNQLVPALLHVPHKEPHFFQGTVSILRFLVCSAAVPWVPS